MDPTYHSLCALQMPLLPWVREKTGSPLCGGVTVCPAKKPGSERGLSHTTLRKVRRLAQLSTTKEVAWLQLLVSHAGTHAVASVTLALAFGIVFSFV